MNITVHEPPLQPDHHDYLPSLPTGATIADCCDGIAEMPDVDFPIPIAWYCTRPSGHEPPHAAHGGPHGPQYATWTDE